MFDWSISSLCFAAAIGAAVGFLSGVFGVGGGFLLVPVLNSVLGVPLPIAVGSTACYTLGPATTAMLARKPRSGFIELPLILGGGLMLGVMAGTESLVYLQSAAPMKLAGRSVAAVDLFVLGFYAVLMTGIAAMSLYDGFRSVPLSRQRGLFEYIPVPPHAEIPDLGRFSIPVLAWTGLVVGFLSGFLGMSGGLILVPAAIYLLGLRVHQATTITIVIVWLVSLQSTLMHALHSHVQLPLVIALLVCGTIGAQIGSEVGRKARGRRLQIGFGLLVLAAAAIVVYRLWRLWSPA